MALTAIVTDVKSSFLSRGHRYLDLAVMDCNIHYCFTARATKIGKEEKETIHGHYVGYIEKQCDDRWLVRFARHVEGKKFKWPEREDVSIFYDGPIKKTLNAPDFTYQNGRVISFSFNDFRGGGMFMKPLNFYSQTPRWHQHFGKIFSI